MEQRSQRDEYDMNIIYPINGPMKTRVVAGAGYLEVVSLEIR
jgi:hypothetical protein